MSQLSTTSKDITRCCDNYQPSRNSTSMDWCVICNPRLHRGHFTWSVSDDRCLCSSYITITASRANSVHEGFLHDRVDIYDPISLFEVPCITTNSGLAYLILTDGHCYSWNPLDQRAWAVQERLLSTCILDYATSITRWTCISAENRDGWKPDGIYSDKATAHLRQLLGSHSHESLHKDKENPDLSTWMHLVILYTSCKLTHGDGRLTALATAAQRLKSYFGDEYLAGL
jgi:hypothetical protein